MKLAYSLVAVSVVLMVVSLVLRRSTAHVVEQIEQGQRVELVKQEELLKELDELHARLDARHAQEAHETAIRNEHIERCRVGGGVPVDAPGMSTPTITCLKPAMVEWYSVGETGVLPGAYTEPKYRRPE